MPTVLIQLPEGQRVIQRDDGTIVIAHDIDDDHGQPFWGRDDYRPLRTWLEEARSIVAGLLPPGAVSAEIIDDRGIRVAAATGEASTPRSSSNPTTVASPSSAVAMRTVPQSRGRCRLTGQGRKLATQKSRAPIAARATMTRPCLPTDHAAAAAGTVTTGRLNRAGSLSVAAAGTRRAREAA